jgi:hypothetical protein
MAAGGPLVIDLVAHGPHGLIGGTSGAGKSELIMSMVAGLIACNSPRSLNLLFIDYKGGAASDVFKDVPHTVGYVTNLDAALARRALTSLRAELNRRMDLLQGRAKDVAEMIRRHGDEAPPSLVIIVDEFATLVKEIPEFVAGIVDIAQRGRSLGIHLMLATQRPSGAVNENIEALLVAAQVEMCAVGNPAADLIALRPQAILDVDLFGLVARERDIDAPECAALQMLLPLELIQKVVGVVARAEEQPARRRDAGLGALLNEGAIGGHARAGADHDDGPCRILRQAEMPVALHIDADAVADFAAVGKPR